MTVKLTPTQTEDIRYRYENTDESLRKIGSAHKVSHFWVKSYCEEHCRLRKKGPGRPRIVDGFTSGRTKPQPPPAMSMPPSVQQEAPAGPSQAMEEAERSDDYTAYALAAQALAKSRRTRAEFSMAFK